MSKDRPLFIGIDAGQKAHDQLVVFDEPSQYFRSVESTLASVHGPLNTALYEPMKRSARSPLVYRQMFLTTYDALRHQSIQSGKGKLLNSK